MASIEGDESDSARRGVPIGVLIVDDNADECAHMHDLLHEALGIDALTLCKPTRTLDVLRDGTFHIVILDLVMPEINGMELLDQIRRYDGDIAIVVVTGYPTVETAVQSLKQSVSDYLRKPFGRDEFVATIVSILRHKKLLTNPEEELHRTIGGSIRRLRKDRDLTLKQISRRTGLSVSLLSQIERAESSASVSSLYKIATALDVRLTELFGEF